MRRRHVLALLAMMAAMHGCQSGAQAAAARGSPAAGAATGQPVAVTSATHCPLKGAADQLLVIDAPSQWDASSAPAARQAPPAAVDWSAHRIVVYPLGVQSTAGHAVDLGARGPVVYGGELVIPVVVRHPRAGMMVAQEITTPCLVLVVPRDGWVRARVAVETALPP